MTDHDPLCLSAEFECEHCQTNHCSCDLITRAEDRGREIEMANADFAISFWAHENAALKAKVAEMRQGWDADVDMLNRVLEERDAARAEVEQLREEREADERWNEREIAVLQESAEALRTEAAALLDALSAVTLHGNTETARRGRTERGAGNG